MRTRACLLIAASAFAELASARDISAQDAVRLAQREAQGRVLSVQTLTVARHKVFRIKILTRDGQVRIVQVKAEQ